jgi:hypothetical protein
MAGGIIQLLVYGAQDIYLTGNPQITFFKIVYRRHTNFSIETFERTFNDRPDFGTIGRVKIYRLGDLMTKMYLKVVINRVEPNEGAKFAWIRRLGHALLNSIAVEIGGVTIDEQCGTWLDIWYELARQGDHESGYLKLIGDIKELTEYNGKPKPEHTLYIPLQFWFNRFNGLALPNIAIQYHEIYVTLRFNERENVIVTNSKFNNLDDVKIIDVGLLIDFIYLDVAERHKFATTAHEYLIEQVQFTGEESISGLKDRFLLHYNYPTKELIWAMRNGNYMTGKKFLCYTHEYDWTKEILKCSKTILSNSVVLSDTEPMINNNEGTIVWEEFETSTSGQTNNGKIDVTNNGTVSLWVNTNSLTINSYSITDKVSGNITVSNNNDIIITGVTTEITERDISFPVEDMTDTRVSSDDVCVNQFSNYGLLITGKHNPIESAKLEINDQERFERRNGKFFNYLQPEMHHSNTPVDGINVYSFSLKPEAHQPMGTMNFSRVENIFLTLWFQDLTNTRDSKREREMYNMIPELNFINQDSKIYIFAFSYNVLRIMSGLSALV